MDSPRPITTAERDRRLLHGAGAGVAAQVLNLAVRFALTPFVLAELGFAAFGFWGLVFVALGLLGVHRMGFVGAAVPLVAGHLAAGRRDRAEAVLRTTASAGVVFAVAVGLPVWLHAEPIVRVFGVTDDLVADAAATLTIASVATFAALALGGYQTILEAHQRHARVRAIEAGAALVEAGLIVVALRAGLGLPGLAWCYAARLALPLPWLAVAARRVAPDLTALPGRADRDALRAVLRFGGSIQGLGTVHLAIQAVDRLALAWFASLAATGGLEVARKLVQTAASLPAQALQPMIPAAAHAAAEDPARAATLLRRATRAIVLFAAIPAGVFVATPALTVRAWIGEVPAGVPEALVALALAGLVHLATGPTTAMLRGLARPRAELTYAIVWLLGAAALVPIGVHFGGLAGAALASAIVQAGVSIGLLWWTWPSLGLTRDQLAADLLRPLAAAAAPTAVFAMVAPDPAAVSRWHAAVFVAGGGVSLAAATAVLALFVAVPGPTRRAWTARVRRRRRPLRPVTV